MSCWIAFAGSILSLPYPPIPLLLGAFSVACCWIVTKCWLVNESCACPFPYTDSIFKVKAAGYINKNKNFHPSEYSMIIMRYWVHLTVLCLITFLAVYTSESWCTLALVFSLAQVIPNFPAVFITNLCFENYHTKDRSPKRYDGPMSPHSFPYWY